MQRMRNVHIHFLFCCFLSCAFGTFAQAASDKDDSSTGGRTRKPNVLFVLVDDLGWRDVGFRDPQFDTPTIDALYSQSIRFNRSYTPPNCGASRAALLSGIYPWRLGLQGNSIRSNSPAAIPPSKPTLAEMMKKDLGYQTHLVGKWHQGFCKTSQTPTKRGFDTFFGFYLTKQDHFTHVAKKEAYDFRNGQKVDKSVQGTYSTELYTKRTVDLLEQYKREYDLDPSDTKPFFMVLAYAAIHGPNQVPQHYINTHCKNVADEQRRIKCGMMAAVDQGLAKITATLRKLNLDDDTIIVFTTDNGGKVEDGSSNWPLRGTKRTLWEGGIRVNTFLYSKSKDILPRRSFTWDGLFYMTDWMATLRGIVTDTQTKRPQAKAVDSLNHWKYLKTGANGRTYRQSFSYVDQDLGVAMLRYRQWKLLYHQRRDAGWYNPPPGVDTPKKPDRDSMYDYQLFDIIMDPEETTDLSHTSPKNEALVKKLASRLRRSRHHAKAPISVRLESDPKKGVWGPGWCGKRSN